MKQYMRRTDGASSRSSCHAESVAESESARGQEPMFPGSHVSELPGDVSNQPSAALLIAPRRTSRRYGYWPTAASSHVYGNH